MIHIQGKGDWTVVATAKYDKLINILAFETEEEASECLAEIQQNYGQDFDVYYRRTNSNKRFYTPKVNTIKILNKFAKVFSRPADKINKGE